MIDEAITVHDAFQVEIKQHLPFAPDGSASRYSSETFVFAPSSLNINGATFPKSHFYRSLKNYIRLHVPTVPLESLLEPEGRLARLMTGGMELPEDAFDPDFPDEAVSAGLAVHQEDSKLFCLFLQRAARNRRLEILAMPGDAERAEACGQYVRVTRQIIDRVFALWRGENIPPHIQATQEFCSTVVSYNALRLLSGMREGSEADRLRDLIRDMRSRRKVFGAGTEPESQGDNAAFVARWNTLKKYVNTPLFLDIRQKREGALIQHLAYALAAALAMIFATAIAFIWQIHYGAVSFPLFVALVVSYIFKDRLKDILRDYMVSAFSRHLSDRRLHVFRNSSNLGTCREVFDFLKESALPSDVRAVRDLTSGELPYALRREEILYYRKRIVVTPGLSPAIDAGGLVDITRLNLWELSRNMDGDTEHLLVLDGEEVHEAVGVKTYPLYVIRRHNHGGVRECTAYRLIMSSAGVRGITRLYPLAD